MTTTTVLCDDFTRRTVAIDVIGGGSQGQMRTSLYTLRVPYTSLSKTLQSIHRRGGKVVQVTVLSEALPEGPLASYGAVQPPLSSPSKASGAVASPQKPAKVGAAQARKNDKPVKNSAPSRGQSAKSKRR